jgi:hypothetical protein
MLIEFSVANFRSIAKRQTLSMVASTRKELRATHVAEDQPLPLLSAAAIFGPNASGKSNLFRAIGMLQWMVQLSATAVQPGQPLPLSPFRLAPEATNQPTEFEIHFITDGVRYQYALSATQQKVVAECLHAYPKGPARLLFERSLDPQGRSTWKMGPSFEGSAQQHRLWQESTRDNALFLSTAVQLNNTQLRPVFDWLIQKLVVLLPGVSMNPFLSIEMLRSEDGAERLLSLLTAADLGINRIELREDDSPPGSLPPFSSPRFMVQVQQPPTTSPPQPKHLRILAWHTRTDGETVPFDIWDESDGTRKLFEHAGGLLRALDNGATVCIDEIDTSLHPYITRFLVQQFQKPQNRHDAQLVFSTHDTTLLDPELLRRDQFWFVEKDSRGRSNLTPLLDYSPRTGESLERGYLKGRYGAVPVIGTLEP